MEEILKRQQRRLREAADDFAAASEAVWEMVIAFRIIRFSLSEIASSDTR